MTLTFPLTTAVFQDKMSIETVRWWLESFQEMSITGGGESLVADLAPRMWKGDVNMSIMTHEKAASVQALIESLDGSLQTFDMFDPRRAYPIDDPTGSILGASTPEIAALNVNNKQLNISGLPAAYKLKGGDMFSFTYSATRRALHRIVLDVNASGAGLASNVEVRPHFRPGVAVGQAISFIKPYCRVRMIPGSFQPGTGIPGGFTEGMSFQVQQVING